MITKGFRAEKRLSGLDSTVLAAESDGGSASPRLGSEESPSNRPSESKTQQLAARVPWEVHREGGGLCEGAGELQLWLRGYRLK